MISRTLSDGTILSLSDLELHQESPAEAGSAFTIHSNVRLTTRPPWEPVQFLEYWTQQAEGHATTTQEIYSYAHDRPYRVVHDYSPSGASVSFHDYPGELAPLRYLGDGFSPWALLCRETATLHASSVTIGPDLYVFVGYHDSGKSTASRFVAETFGGTLLSDDSLCLTLTSDCCTRAAPAFWDEAGTHRLIETTERLNIVVLDDGAVKSGENDEALSLSLPMLLMQFLVGAYCSEGCFDAGSRIVEELLCRSGLHVVGPRPSRDMLIGLVSATSSELEATE